MTLLVVFHPHDRLGLFIGNGVDLTMSHRIQLDACKFTGILVFVVAAVVVGRIRPELHHLDDKLSECRHIATELDTQLGAGGHDDLAFLVDLTVAINSHDLENNLSVFITSSELGLAGHGLGRERI
ncbi:hypothetical protein HG530_011568 [Fusarium avenaceum]|nr:hypothetical protein HG530_011568 [Fusarium avenaceum]